MKIVGHSLITVFRPQRKTWNAAYQDLAIVKIVARSWLRWVWITGDRIYQGRVCRLGKARVPVTRHQLVVPFRLGSAFLLGKMTCSQTGTSHKA